MVFSISGTVREQYRSLVNANGFSNMYATIKDSNVVVFPVPEGISSKQWPYD